MFKFLFSKITKKSFSISEMVVVIFLLIFILIVITPLFTKKTEKEILTKEPVEEVVIKEQINESDSTGCLIYKGSICEKCYPIYLLKDNNCILLKDINCKTSKDGKTCNECLENYENINGECKKKDNTNIKEIPKEEQTEEVDKTETLDKNSDEEPNKTINIDNAEDLKEYDIN